MSMVDEILEGIWINENEKTQIKVLLKQDSGEEYILHTNEDTSLWIRFFEKFNSVDVDYFTEKITQRQNINKTKEKKIRADADELKNLFDAKLKAFEIDEVQLSANKLLRSKIRKSTNIIELNAWVTAILLESLSIDDE
jgi:hypothetical protein